jgi:hypothetical protein
MVKEVVVTTRQHLSGFASSPSSSTQQQLLARENPRGFQQRRNRHDHQAGFVSVFLRSLPVHGDGAREHGKDGGTVVVSVRMEKKQISIIFGPSHSLTHTSHRGTFSTREIWREPVHYY